MSTLLEVRNASRRFGGLSAVDGVGFSLAEGEIAALIGPNGAGKSTLFNLLGGALKPSGGQILFRDRDIAALPPHKRARLGIQRTFQIAQTFRSMTGRENAAAALMAADRHAAGADALLDAVGIADAADRPVGALAYGDVKRLELAMAMASEPVLLLLDEPTAGMAGAERMAIMETVIGLARAKGVTVLFTEHDMDAVFGFAARVLVMDQGRLIADADPDAVRADRRVQAVYLGEDAADA